MVNIDINSLAETRRVNNFWNSVHFHPTDAIEDDWGKAIIDSMASDGVADFMRIFAMLEDIVSKDENGELVYDFSLNDKRIDYLAKKGFNLLICFNFMPDCIALNEKQDIGIPRYKGKRVNNSVPKDYGEWEQVCFRYMEHILERYGEERVKNWRFHCWNEPDHEYWVTSKTCFDYERDGDSDKIKEYIKLYDAFAAGVKKAYKNAKIGGPSAAYCDGFIREFLAHIAKEQKDNFDFLSMHAYSDILYSNTDGEICPENIVKRIELMHSMLNEYGLDDVELIMDEWGAAAGGFLSIKKNPKLVMRENAFFPAFYFKLIKLTENSGADVSHMLICLSGQHKSVSDFDGYRSFFTKSKFKKPIYNGYCLAARLGNEWIDVDSPDCIATVTQNGDLAIAVYNLEDSKKEIIINITGLNGAFKLRTTMIDSKNANSYEVWKAMGAPQNYNDAQKEKIMRDGELKQREKNIEVRGTYSAEFVLSSYAVQLIEIIKITGEDDNSE